MKNCLFLFLALLLFGCKSGQIEQQNKSGLLVDYVNPLIGTTGKYGAEYGGMIPGVTMPFGMTQWTAMTRKNQVSVCPYHYKDEKIIGFMGTHQPAIWMGDYGFISFMPQTGETKFRAAERGIKYRHEDETATPYYYSVRMKDGDRDIFAEHTATERCAFFQFSFPDDQESSISIEMSRLKEYDGYVKIIPEKKQVIGYNSDRHNNVWGTDMGPEIENFKGYYILQFDTEFESFGTYRDTAYAYTISNDVKVFEQKAEIKGEKVGAFVTFSKKENNKVKVKVASSFISFEQAQDNLNKEIKSWDFETTKNNCKDTWENHLNRIKIEGGTYDQKVNFYSSFYHTLLFPRLFSEYGRYYSAFDDTIHSGVSYNDYSLWDTYRALHPLLLFTAPEHVNPMITSLLQMYDESGWIPKWPNLTFSNIMIGTHSDAVIADAYIKGFRDFDSEKAYEAMYKNAMTPPENDKNNRWGDRARWTSYEARGGLSYYKSIGYVPADKTNESVSRTLEFAYGDFCVAQMAKALGKNEDYDYFLKRSKNYKNVYNPNAGFMQPKLFDGSFFSGHPWKYRAFTEGSPWTYLFCCVQDVNGLVDLMGGKESFVQKLDENFNSGHYRHNNEPGHHYIYLYNYVDQAWKTQEKVREVLADKYLNQPDGLCGNDDCGQMSAWYMFSSLGFYPVAPGSDEYAIGSPLFEKAIIKLTAPYPEKEFVIIAKNVSEQNKYVKSITLDGKVLEKPFIKHSDIVNGRELVFEMSDKPNL